MEITNRLISSTSTVTNSTCTNIHYNKGNKGKMSIQDLPQDKDSLFYDWYREKEEMSSAIKDALKQRAILGLTPMGFDGTKAVPDSSEFDFERVFLVWDAATWCFYGTFMKPKPEVSEYNKEFNSLILCGLIEQVVNFETWGRVSGITYGELILGMFMAGYKIKRIPRSKVCQFNISENNIKYLLNCIEIRMRNTLSHRKRCGIATPLS